MILKCAACGGEMEIPGNVPKGTRVKCPYCGERLEIDGPHRIDLPQGGNLSRFVRSGSAESQEPSLEDTQKQRFYVRRPSKPVAGVQTPPPVSACPPSHVSRKGRPTNKGNAQDILIYIALALVLGGAAVYWQKTSKHGNDNGQVAGPVSADVVRNQDRSNQDEIEKKKRAERIAKEEAEREKRRAEKAERDAERERKRKEMADKAAKERQLRDLLVKMETGFCGAATVFAVDFPEKERPFYFAEDEDLFLAGMDFVAGRSLYKVTCEKGQVRTVQRMSQREGVVDVDAKKFMEEVKDKIVLVRKADGPVWICGNVKSSEMIPVPATSRSFSPLADFMGDGFAIANALKALQPAIKFRVTLKSQDGKTEIKLGVVEKEIDVQQVRSKIREMITDRKLKSRGVKLKPPRLKTFKRTVVFYEGEKIFKTMTGITQVPRSFKFFGTSRNHDNKSHVQDIIERAWRKWEDLKKEAERQERVELEIETENQRLMDEYRRKAESLVQNARPTESEVDAEIENYKLFVERSRSRLLKE